MAVVTLYPGVSCYLVFGKKHRTPKSYYYSFLTSVIPLYSKILYLTYIQLAPLVIVSVTLLLVLVSFYQPFEWKIKILRYSKGCPRCADQGMETCLIRAFNSLEWVLNSPPKPHAFQSLSLQSHVKFNFNLLKKTSISAPLLLLVLFGIFMTLSHRIPVRIMFTELDILPYYPLYNAFLACFVTMAIFGIKNKSYSSVNIAFAFIFSLSGSLLLAYINLHSRDLLALILTIFGIDISLLAYEYNSGSGSCYKKLPDTTIGGGGSGSGSGSGSSRPQATSSGDNTTRAPASVQYLLNSIPEETTAMLHDPVKLLHGMDNYHSAFRIIDNLPNNIKADIIKEAESLSPPIEQVHPQIPQKKSLLDYWNYKIANSKAIKEVKITELLVEKGHVTSLENKVLLDNHKQICDGIRNVSFYKMKQIFENDFNHKDKRFIKRHMTDYVTGDTPSDAE